MPEAVETDPVTPVRDALVKELPDHVFEGLGRALHGVAVAVSKDVSVGAVASWLLYSNSKSKAL